MERQELLNLTLEEYINQFGEANFYFVEGNMLYCVFEGDGSNLLEEDIEHGCKDYWYATQFDFDKGEVDGGQLLTTEVIQSEAFLPKTIAELLDYFDDNMDILLVPDKLEEKIVDPEFGEEIYEMCDKVETILWEARYKAGHVSIEIRNKLREGGYIE